MFRFVRISIATALTTSLLLASFAASMHSHRSVESAQDSQAALAACSCQLPHQNQPSSDGDQEQHPSEECLLCRLIVDFQADLVESMDVEFDSMVTTCSVTWTASVRGPNIRLFEGRAPPVS